MPLVPRTLAIVPPGGYAFVDRSTGVEVRIEGGDFEDLAKRVLSHRLANNRPPGEPLREIYDELCGRNPGFCMESVRQPLEPTAAHSRSRDPISLRVAAWIADFYRRQTGAPGASESTAMQRAETCFNCPKNVDYREGCASCIENIQRLAFIWKGPRGLPYDNRLFACDVLGMHLGCAVWGDRLPPVSAEARAVLPDNCWRKREN